MKRIISLALSAALLAALLCACGEPSSQTSELPSGDPGESATVPPEDTPSEKPSEDVPTDSDRVDLAAFYLTLTEKYGVPRTPEQAYPDELADDDTMWEFGPDTREERLQSLEEMRGNLRDLGLATYADLSDIATEQCLVYVAEISFSASEAVLVQVSDAADVNAVKDILQARVDAQSENTWYPLAAEAWQQYARIVSNGSYVMLIVGEDCDAVVDDFNALFD